jgi:predicted permease
MFKKISKAALGSTTFLTLATQAYAGTSVGKLSVTKSGSAGVDSISTLISAGFNIAIIIAIIFVFFMLIMGGYGWISAGGDKAKVEEARTRITNAIIGLAIVAAAWALINIIGQFFGLSLENLEIPSATGGSGL